MSEHSLQAHLLWIAISKAEFHVYCYF